MGSSKTPTYRIEYTTSDGSHLTPATWYTTSRRNDVGTIIRHGLGNPTEQNIGEHVRALNASFARGGINFDERRGLILITRARVVRQSDDHVTAEWVDLSVGYQEVSRIHSLKRKLAVGLV